MSDRETPPPVRDATTVLLLRDAIDGIYAKDAMPDGIDATGDATGDAIESPEAALEVFMVRRTRKAAFMPSAMVFPGGRLDDDDLSEALAARCDLDADAAGERLGMDDGRRALGLLVAGVRETFEEAGVLLAHRDGAVVDLRDPGDAKRFAGHRDALNAGELGLGEIVEREGLVLSVAALWPYARWVTPPIESRRFDARFLVTRAPVGQTALHDAVETTASGWWRPGVALAAYEAGEIQLAPPTLRVLLELDAIGSAGAVIDGCGGQVPAPIAPQPQPVGSELHLVLPGDADYDPPGAGRDRICLRGGRWFSEQG